jgi:hypothetical protein
MKLSREQAAALSEKIGPMVSYLVRLRERMTKVGFPMVDPLYQSVREAEIAIRDLWVKLHNASCAGGIGKPPENR